MSSRCVGEACGLWTIFHLVVAVGRLQSDSSRGLSKSGRAIELFGRCYRTTFRPSTATVMERRDAVARSNCVLSKEGRALVSIRVDSIAAA